MTTRKDVERSLTEAIAKLDAMHSELRELHRTAASGKRAMSMGRLEQMERARTIAALKESDQRSARLRSELDREHTDFERSVTEGLRDARIDQARHDELIARSRELRSTSKPGP